MRRILSWGACAAALLFATPSVHASGFDSARIGGERGHAAASTPFATYYNPAALSGTKKWHLGADLTLALHSASYDRTKSSVPEPMDAPGSNTGTDKLFNVLAAPTLAASARFGNFAVGLGFFAPMSGSMNWGGNAKFKGNSMYPGAQDGTARWQLIQGDQLTLYYSLGASYLIPSWRLSFGAGANLIYATTRMLRARTGTGTDPVANEGRIDLDVAGVTGSFSLGSMWEAMRNRLWIGASYQAPPGMYSGLTMTGNVRSYFNGDTKTGDTKQKVELHENLPDIVRLAVRYKEDRYELRAFGDYTRWSVVDQQCVSKVGGSCAVDGYGQSTAGAGQIISNQIRHWKDSVGVRLGGSYWFTPGVEGFVGLGYETNAIPGRYLTADVLDGRKLSGALGARIALGSRTALALSYTHVQMLSRTIHSNYMYDHLRGESKMPSAAGEYKQWTGMFNSFLEFYLD